jgi:iron complex outermembrane receptor protein
MQHLKIQLSKTKKYPKIIKLKTLKLIFIQIFCLSQIAFSQENIKESQENTKEIQENIKETKIDEVVIEATKILSFATSPVIAIIEQKDIQFAPVNNLQDLLEYLQGVDIRTRGAEGIQADVSIRGGTFDQTVVLLNGVNFTDPQTGHFSLNIPIDINIIERIEVLQGTDSWISGVPAFCGAINIITKNPTANTISPYLTYGSNDFYQGGISLTGKSNSSKISGIANLNYTQTNGYAENTDFYIANFYLLLNYKDAQIGNFEFQTGYLEKEFGANSFYSIRFREQFEMNKSFISSLKYNNNFGKNEKINLNSSIYYRLHKDRFELFRWEAADWYAGHNFHHTDIWGINSSIDYKWNLGITTVGIDFRSEKIKSTNLGDILDEPIPVPNEENIFYKRSKLRLHEDFYLKHYYSSDKWDLQLGTMAAGNNEFDFKLISGGNFRFLISSQSSILLTVHQGYRLPTFTDLCYDSPDQKGNLFLKPEESINTEIAYKWNNSQLFFQSNIFYRYGYRIIDWVRLFDETVWHSENLTNVASLGFDISTEYNFDFFTVRKIKLSYSYLDVKKHSPDNYLSLYSTDFLRHQLVLGVFQRIWSSKNTTDNLVANWQFRLQSRSGFYINASSEVIDYPTFILCDLKIIWRFNFLNFFIEATNLFDQQYVDIGNLPQPGLWLKAGVNLRLPL